MASDRRPIALIWWATKEHVDNGRFFLFENPPTSVIWKDPQFAATLQYGLAVIGHGRQHGKTGGTGPPIRKA